MKQFSYMCETGKGLCNLTNPLVYQCLNRRHTSSSYCNFSGLSIDGMSKGALALKINV